MFRAPHPRKERGVSYQGPTDTSKQPIRTRYLGDVTGYQPIRDQYFLIRPVPDYHSYAPNYSQGNNLDLLFANCPEIISDLAVMRKFAMCVSDHYGVSAFLAFPHDSMVVIIPLGAALFSEKGQA
eukprot:sb/3475706/